MNPRRESEGLMNAVLPLAERMLREYGEFYPYGGYMKPNGEIVNIGAKDEETEYPKSKDLTYVLRDFLSRLVEAGECKATVLVFDVRVNLPGTGTKGDALQVCLDHQDGYSAEVFVPYEVCEDGHVTYGETFAQEGRYEVFGKQ